MSYTFAVSDVHGCRDALDRLIALIEGRAETGTIVFLGDYVDRGPDSKGVLQRLIAGPPPGWTWICLKGNHEDMMVGALAHSRDRQWWLDNGGLETERSYGGQVESAHLAWADDLPLLHQDAHRIFVHAGVIPERPLDKQNLRDLLWLRPISDPSVRYWGKHLVHGHTPSSRNPQTIGNRTNVDGACVFGGVLAAAVFDNEIAGPPIDVLRVGR